MSGVTPARITRGFRFRQGCAYFCPHFGWGVYGAGRGGTPCVISGVGARDSGAPGKTRLRASNELPRALPSVPYALFLAENSEDIMIYELRIYHCVTGRLPALLKRFETTTLELWKRHGIRQAGFWTVLVGDGGNQDLHYLLAWESLAERETKWNKFASDPEWLAKRAESERDGPIIASIKNMFLQPTAFSAVK